MIFLILKSTEEYQKMNQDIAYEILRCLYLDGEAIIAKRLIFALKFSEIQKLAIKK